MGEVNVDKDFDASAYAARILTCTEPAEVIELWNELTDFNKVAGDSRYAAAVHRFPGVPAKILWAVDQVIHTRLLGGIDANS